MMSLWNTENGGPSFTNIARQWSTPGINYAQVNFNCVSVVRFDDDGPLDTHFIGIPEYVVSFAIECHGDFQRAVRGGCTRTCVLGPYEIVLLNPNSSRRVRRGGRVRGAHLLFDRTQIGQFVREHTDRPCTELVLRDESVVHDPVLRILGEEIVTEAASVNPREIRPAIHEIETLALALVARMMARHSNLSPHHATQTLSEGPGPSRRGVARAIDYIHRHLPEPLTLEELADVAYLSPYHFTRLFKSAIGATPHAYLVQQRLKRACELLATTDTPITAIAMDCGFGSASHFSSVFRDKIGTPPGAYRRTCTA